MEKHIKILGWFYIGSYAFIAARGIYFAYLGLTGSGGLAEGTVLPILGLIGMLMGWWRIRISSGCP